MTGKDYQQKYKLTDILLGACNENKAEDSDDCSTGCTDTGWLWRADGSIGNSGYDNADGDNCTKRYHAVQSIKRHLHRLVTLYFEAVLHLMSIIRII